MYLRLPLLVDNTEIFSPTPCCCKQSMQQDSLQPLTLLGKKAGQKLLGSLASLLEEFMLTI